MFYKRRLIGGLFFSVSFLCADNLLEIESKAIQRSFAHLDIGDELSAISELKVALSCQPYSKQIRLALIKILAESAEDLEAIRLWKESINLFEELKDNVEIIEALSWGVLKKAQSTSQKTVKLSSLFGASLSQDIKTVYFLKDALVQNDAQIRLVAAKIASRFGDKILIDTMKEALKREKVWYVRLEIIRSLAKLRVQELAPFLEDILQNSQASYEEKAIAAESLLMIYEDISPKQLQSLIQSRRSGHRIFACQIVSYLNLHLPLEDMTTLLEDSSFEVQSAILMALSTIKLDSKEIDFLEKKLHKLAQSENDYVKLSAHWLLARYGYEESLIKLYQLSFDDHFDIRLLSSVFLARSGKAGENLALQVLEKTQDPFVQVNISYALLGFSDKKDLLCKTLYQFLENHDQKIMWRFFASHNFKLIVSSQVKHIPEIMNYPSLIDDQTRLSLLNILAIFRFPLAEKAIKDYLQSKYLGSTFTASRALLEEGHSDAEEIIKGLLADKDIHIRVQAGLVLALYGEDERAFEVLKEAYYLVDKDVKTSILEALGQLGSKKAVPFLVNLLDDPFNGNRILAASAILQCLYH